MQEHYHTVGHPASAFTSCTDPLDDPSDSESASDSGESFGLYSGSEDEQEMSEEDSSGAEELDTGDDWDMIHERFEHWEVETEGASRFKRCSVVFLMLRHRRGSQAL